MNASYKNAEEVTANWGRSFMLAAAVATAFLAQSNVARAGDQEPVTLAEEDAVCLKCHGQPGFGKKLPDGRTRPLHISEKGFVQSVHLNDGCAACHSEEGEECLEKDGSEFASKRAHSIAQMKGCVDCHKVAVKAYENSVHAAMLKASDAKQADKTAVCSDCHSVHAERFFDAKNKCLTCHEETVAQHRDWLPKTERHLATIACEACHAPGAPRRVTLRLYEGDSPLTVSAGVPQFRKVSNEAGAQPASLDARALWSLLKEFNSEGAGNKTVLRGRLEVHSAAKGHDLAEKSQAIRNCDTCHREGADAFKSVTVSIVGPDGKPLHAPADKAVLNSMESLGSVGGFYVLGATRIKLLDHLLLLTVVAGTGIPIGHLSLRMFSKWMRARRDAGRNRNETNK